MEPLDVLKTCHRDVLKSIADNHEAIGKDKLTTFFPLKGAKYAGDLMLIGRAVNGWRNFS